MAPLKSFGQAGKTLRRLTRHGQWDVLGAVMYQGLWGEHTPLKEFSFGVTEGGQPPTCQGFLCTEQCDGVCDRERM